MAAAATCTPARPSEANDARMQWQIHFYISNKETLERPGQQGAARARCSSARLAANLAGRRVSRGSVYCRRSKCATGDQPGYPYCTYWLDPITFRARLEHVFNKVCETADPGITL